jgi:hypothetical protein
MFDKGVVLNIPGDIYSVLNDERDKRKLATGKRLPIAAIVYEYFTIGLQSKLSGIVISPDNNGEQTANAPSAIYMQHSALELAKKEKQLEAREQRLNSWENTLRSRDSDLRDRELELCDSIEELSQKKIVFAEAKELSAEKAAENMRANVTASNHLEKIQRLNEENHALKNEINYLKDNVMGMLERVSGQVGDLPQKDILREYIFPLLPSLLIILQFILTSKNMNSTSEIKKMMKEFAGMFGGLDEKKIADIIKMWQDINGNTKKGRSP